MFIGIYCCNHVLFSLLHFSYRNHVYKSCTSTFFIQKPSLQVLHFIQKSCLQVLHFIRRYHVQPLHFIHRYYVYSFCISYIETMSIGFCVSAYHIENMSIEFPKFSICIYHQANTFIVLNNKISVLNTMPIGFLHFRKG